MKPYPKYKDSGIEWIGEIPDGWKVSKIKHETQLINGCAFKPDEWSYNGTPIIRIENLNGGEEFNCFNGDVEERYHVKKGDLLFAWSGNIGTSFGPFLWQKEGRFYLNQHIFRLADYLPDTAFFYWLLKAVTVYVESKAHGIIGLVHVTKGELGGIEVPIPKTEQRSIASYLGRKTQQIDALIEKKQKQIILFREQRTAVINEAVTKGLNPKAKMKDIGIEWIGEIPETWEVSKVKFHASKIGSGITPRGGAQVYLDSGVPLLRSQNIYSDGLRMDDVAFISEATHLDMIGSAVHPHDVLMNITGASIGRCAFVPDDLPVANVNQHVCIVRPRNSIDARFLHFFLSSGVGQQQVETGLTGAAREGLTHEQLGNFFLFRPDIEEQKDIIAHLDRTTFNFDAMIAKEERLIALLREYRTSLISEVVTGKIDVRSEAA